MKVYQCGFIASQGIGVPDCSKDISSPTPNQVSVDGIELVQIYPGGWGFGLGSTKNGDLYSWGVNQATLLGKSGMFTDLFPEQSIITRLQLYSLPHLPPPPPLSQPHTGSADDGANPSTLDIIAYGVTTAAAGFDHIVFVQNQGAAVFALGPSFPSSSPPSSSSSHSPHLTPIPLFLPPSHSVVSIACGEHHTLLLLSSGDVHGFGSNTEGQLGIPLSTTTTVPPSQPVHILGPSLLTSSIGGNSSSIRNSEISTTYTAIAAGARHSVALTSSGRCVAFGWSLHAQCGELSPTVSTPTIISALGPLKCTSAAAGSGHTLVATEDGAVYAWGQNNDGQCSGEHSAIIEPTLVEAVEDTIVKVAAGARHSILLSDKGRAYAFGFGKFGQLGGGRAVEGGRVVSPTQMMLVPDGCEKVVDIACGWWHTLLVCE